MTSKKIVYTSDFKLQVLDYYFRHGGHENFGLKTKTAVHFNIDKKTINRLLNNQEMVKRARRILARRHAPSTAATTTKPSTSKSSSSASKVTSRPSASSKPSSKVTSTSSSSSSAASKSAKSGKLKSKVVPGKVGGKSGSASGSPQSGSASVASGASKGSGGVPSSSRVPGHGGTEGVKVFELPEDPDYSLLKPSIAASANGVANVAKLLVTGTQEVRKLMLDECEIIFECRVCRSLFRSVVNFLAHKRIYCQKVFADVRTLFHRDNIEGVTNQSGTVIVEPEDPPPTPPPTDLPRPAPAPEVKEESRSQRRIDSIADRLAGRRDGRTGQSEEMFLSHPTQTGSSKYFERLQSINAERDKLSQDCSVVLEDIRGVVNARIQTFSPNSSTEPQPMSEMLQEVSQRSQGVTVALGESGKIIKTVRGEADEMEVDEVAEESGRQTNTEADLICKLCNTHFATAKTKAIHQRSFHGLKRLIYTCPICRATLTNMFGVAKHLEEVHHKTKHQTNRLKKVIRKNAIKHASVSTEEEEDVALGKKEAESVEGAAAERIEGQTEVIGSTNKPAVSRASAVTRNSRVSASSPATTTTTTTTSTLSTRKSSSTRLSQKRDEGRGSVATPEHRCGKCERRFMTPQALISHDKFCSLQQMSPQPVLLPKSPLSPRLRSEMPEKRIAIQIRKDYKKSLTPEAKDESGTLEVPETPTADKVNALMAKMCRLPSLTCIPCNRKYQTMTTLKRHVSVHFNWTRYACRKCPFRSYNRYEQTRHATSEHGVSESAAASLVLEDVAFGPIRYSLTEDEKEENGEKIQSARVNSAASEVNGISEAEEEEEKQGRRSARRRHTDTDTHSHTPTEVKKSMSEDQPSATREEVPDSKSGTPTHGHTPSEESETENLSAILGVEDQRNGSETPSVDGSASDDSAGSDESPRDIPSPHTPPLTNEIILKIEKLQNDEMYEDSEGENSISSPQDSEIKPNEAEQQSDGHSDISEGESEPPAMDSDSRKTQVKVSEGTDTTALQGHVKSCIPKASDTLDGTGSERVLPNDGRTETGVVLSEQRQSVMDERTETECTAKDSKQANVNKMRSEQSDGEVEDESVQKLQNKDRAEDVCRASSTCENTEVETDKRNITEEKTDVGLDDGATEDTTEARKRLLPQDDTSASERSPAAKKRKNCLSVIGTKALACNGQHSGETEGARPVPPVSALLEGGKGENGLTDT